MASISLATPSDSSSTPSRPNSPRAIFLQLSFNFLPELAPERLFLYPSVIYSIFATDGTNKAITHIEVLSTEFEGFGKSGFAKDVDERVGGEAGRPVLAVGRAPLAGGFHSEDRVFTSLVLGQLKFVLGELSVPALAQREYILRRSRHCNHAAIVGQLHGPPLADGLDLAREIATVVVQCPACT